ncbi:MAG: GTPase HflX [Candidatus Polarisedimenticolaceae bacterium]|nr:GTPase HflX [Candidatus Polarisedimenticolaceae bacterium]
MFDRPKSGERAVLVHLNFGAGIEQEASEEFWDLAVSAGAQPVAVISGKRTRPDAGHFVGKGKVDEIKDALTAFDAGLVIFNHQLSPSQERNLEAALSCRVVDRTGLILDIFAQRAHSFEGKLQVELAQLRHLSTRLVRGWTHLERQKGGIGLRGPGETQLETDRRLLGVRITHLGRRLEKVESQRNQGRRARKRADMPTVSLVGYTNAGKSTLFNRLSGAAVYAADQLFATLDPTLRRIETTESGPLILADTVGFVRDLPHDLVAAFKSTLQETTSADLLLHVIDGANPTRAAQIDEVNSVLRQIGADEVPQIEIYNKIDADEQLQPKIEWGEDGLATRVWLSAKTGEGVDLLMQALARFFHRAQTRHVLRLSPTDGRLRAKLYEVGRVISDQPTDEGGWEMDVTLAIHEFNRLLNQEDGLEQRLIA